jgi:hypothetical protein
LLRKIGHDRLGYSEWVALSAVTYRSMWLKNSVTKTFYLFLISATSVREGNETDFFFFFRLFVGFSTVGRIITHNQQDDSLGGAVDQTDPISVHCTIYLDKKDYELTICYN